MHVCDAVELSKRRTSWGTTAIDRSRISDFTCGKYFNEHSYFQGNRSLIRLHFYFDQLEVCNPLGSFKSKNKLACFYFFVGNIGLNYYSSLRNIFLALVVKTDTLKKHCLSKIVAPLVKDLQKFQTEGVFNGQ